MIANLKKSKVQDGLIFIILSAWIIKEALNYHKYGSWALSPSLIPIGIAGVMVFLSVIMILSAIREEIAEQAFSLETLKNPVLVFVVTVLYLVLLPMMHFLIATCSYLVLMMLILGERKLLNILLISIAIPSLLYGLFDVLLGVRLP